MSTPEIVQVLRGRSFRDTLFGKVRYGQAKMRVDGETKEIPVVIKEYDRELVERRMTRNGEHVGEDAKEELRIHSLLSQAVTCPTPTSPSSPLSAFGPCGHPHVVHLFDVRKDEKFYFAILEYCSRGSSSPSCSTRTSLPSTPATTSANSSSASTSCTHSTSHTETCH